MHSIPQVNDLAIILGVAALVAFTFQKTKLPAVLGYIVAGMIVGPYTPTGLYVADPENIKVWSHLGVIFLMFSLGLEFTFHKLMHVGAAALGTAIGEVSTLFLLGFSAVLIVTGKQIGRAHV